MSMPWFRLYHEFSTDHKIQMLSEQDQRRYIMILCMKCCNGSVTLQNEDVTFQLRISNDEWKKTKEILISKNLIDKQNNPIAWEKRQFISDSSNERVAKHRMLKKQGKNEFYKDKNTVSMPTSKNVTFCNVTVTPSDTDTDTDTDTDIKKEIQKKKVVADAPRVSVEVLEIFDFWKITFGKNEGTKLDKKRISVITNALKNYSIEELQRAIAGYTTSDFHMGRQPGHAKRQIELDLILRDAAHIEKFWEVENNQSKTPTDVIVENTLRAGHEGYLKRLEQDKKLLEEENEHARLS